MKPALTEAEVTAQASRLLNRISALLDGADSQVVLTAAVSLLIEAIQHRYPGNVIQQLSAITGVGRVAAQQINAANFNATLNALTPKTETLQ